MNLFCGNLEELFKKYQVYSVPTMGMDDFMVVSGMPSVLGKHVDDDYDDDDDDDGNGVVGKHGKQVDDGG